MIEPENQILLSTQSNLAEKRISEERQPNECTEDEASTPSDLKTLLRHYLVVPVIFQACITKAEVPNFPQ